MKMKYSVKYQEEGYSYAQEYSLNVSYKSLTQVCKNIRGLPVAKALDFLNKAEKMETAVLFQPITKDGAQKRIGW